MSAATTPRNFIDAVVTLTDDNSNSNSAPLLLGTVTVSGLKPDGREREVYEARGAVTGDRKGKRAFVTITIEAQVHRLDNSFYQQAMGDIANFGSVTADIGDYPANDLAFAEAYSTETRSMTFDDCALTEFSYTAGSPGQVSMSFECIGPVVIDGITYVPSR